ncbi:MAG: GNAT family N-acetyltransferase [Propionibacteriaceae bacterium]
MPFEAVLPDDSESIARSVALTTAARVVDDPERVPSIPELVTRHLRHGWHLEPRLRFLYVPPRQREPVGVLDLAWPTRDNPQILSAALNVHPDHRRGGHGSAMIKEVRRFSRSLGRDTIWISGPKDSPGAAAFAHAHGFLAAGEDTRRRLVLADLAPDRIEALTVEAQRAAADYRLERHLGPTPSAVLEELVHVAASINEAPTGDLTSDDELFDLQRLQDFETACVRKEERLYRVVARRRDTGEAVGETVTTVTGLRPDHARQEETAVAREHRGHRLGLLLKLEMLRWLAETEPQLTLVETWNNAQNTHVIAVNDALGYRLSRTYVAYELILPDLSSSTPEQIALAGA